MPQPNVMGIVKVGVQNHATKERRDLSRNEGNIRSHLLVPDFEHSILVTEASCGRYFRQKQAIIWGRSLLGWLGSVSKISTGVMGQG